MDYGSLVPRNSALVVRRMPPHRKLTIAPKRGTTELGYQGELERHNEPDADADLGAAAAAAAALAADAAVEPAPAAAPKTAAELAPLVSRELVCPLCSELFSNAVIASCCGDSFCDGCAQLQLATHGKCAGCGGAAASLRLLPNKQLRHAVGKHRARFPHATLRPRVDGDGERARAGDAPAVETTAPASADEARAPAEAMDAPAEARRADADLRGGGDDDDGGGGKGGKYEDDDDDDDDDDDERHRSRRQRRRVEREDRREDLEVVVRDEASVDHSRTPASDAPAAADRRVSSHVRRRDRDRDRDRDRTRGGAAHGYGRAPHGGGGQFGHGGGGWHSQPSLTNPSLTNPMMLGSLPMGAQMGAGGGAAAMMGLYQGQMPMGGMAMSPMGPMPGSGTMPAALISLQQQLMLQQAAAAMFGGTPAGFCGGGGAWPMAGQLNVGMSHGQGFGQYSGGGYGGYGTRGAGAWRAWAGGGARARCAWCGRGGRLEANAVTLTR